MIKYLKLSAITILSTLVFSACSSSQNEPYKYVMPYASETEIAARESPVSLLQNNMWNLQFPSGSAENGMTINDLSTEFKNKYFSKYTSADNKQYIRFSLDASDEGKSTNGSSVRVELAQKSSSKWGLTGNHSFEYTFWGTCSDITTARFTIGQFLAGQLPDPEGGKATDRPLCRIENECGTLLAKVRNYYEKDAVDTTNGDPIKIDLGQWIPSQETTIKIVTEDKKLTIYRDGVAKGTTTFTDKVLSDNRNYFKLGIYYQNKDSPKIFSEIFVRDMKAE